MNKEKPKIGQDFIRGGYQFLASIGGLWVIIYGDKIELLYLFIIGIVILILDREIRKKQGEN